MQIQERLIVPGLGIVILLSAFMLGVPLVYKLVLGLLGLAAAGTYLAPNRVQVETRVAIAALGLIILLIVTSTAFWLTLLSFGAIAALQFPHRHKLQRNPATIEWLGTVWRDIQARRSGRVVEKVDGEGETTSPTLPGFIRVNAAGIGGLVAGLLVLAAVFMPWYGFLISAYGETAGGENLTLRAASEELDLPVTTTFFYVLAGLGGLSVIAIVLPRVVAAIIAVLGLVTTIASYGYVVAQVEREVAELSQIGVGATTLPAVGALLAGACFLVMLVLQLIPGANRSR